jgi:hypothetical protein
MITAAQRQALGQIEDLMREHFEAGIAILRADDDDNDLTETTDIVYHGGYSQAVGLLVVGKKQMLRKRRRGMKE